MSAERTPLCTRTEIINWLIARQGYASYLEIGVGDGAHFRAVRCLDKESVDPAEEGEYAGATPTHRMTSDEFFARNTRMFDLVFIDGLHHADVVYRDLCNALRVLTPSGMVVCHDLNPTSEEMQRVPRAVSAWTGDCWKAWVRLRTERPELPMVVANVDYGVGVIFPEAKFTVPIIAPMDDEMDWTNFSRERRAWLNLVPPGVLGEVLFGDRESEDGLTMVTLWRGDWSPVQADLLRWMAAEKLPAGTKFVWVAPEESATEAALEDGWAAFEARGEGYSCEFVPTPTVEVHSFVEKHHFVAALYNEALKGVRSKWVVFVEDDVIPAAGGVERLLAVAQAQPLDTAVIAAAYRRRENPDEVTATDANWVYFPWPDEDACGLVEVLWAGGGFTIYRGTALRGAGMLYAQSDGCRLWGGWDVNLCKTLREQGYRVFMDMGIRADHRFAGDVDLSFPASGAGGGVRAAAPHS